MKMNFRAEIFLLIVTILFPVFALRADAQTMNDYCVVPPFISNPVAPNVLLVLDESGSMQFPAYLGCTFEGYSSKRTKCGTIDGQTSPQYNYDPGRDYYGLFKTDKYYLYSGAKFEENDLCSYSDNIGGPDCIPGNLLNWSTMSRIDLLRKALVGGKSVAQQGTVHTLRGEGGHWTFSDPDLYCTFNVSGGVFPDLDHELTISNYEPPGACTPDSLYSDNFDDGTLDSKWTAEDIGTSIAGSQSEAGGILSVQADGSTMWGASDEFRYIHQTLSGDFDVRLRIITPPTETGQTYAKAGLMVRADNSAGSRHVKAMATNLAGLQFSSRTSDGGSTSILGDYVNISYPVWVRLVRTGDTFNAFYSSDGQDWTQHSSTTVSMPTAVLVGMAASSYSSVSLGTAEYDEFIYCVSNPCKLGTLPAAKIEVDLPDKERRGVIQKMADTDYDGDFDEGAPRFGLMIYAQDRVGCMKVGIKGETMATLVDKLQTEAPYAGTPTGPALDEARDYCSQSNDNSNCGNSSFIGSPKGSSNDPWYDDGEPVPCRETFVLLISDGQWNIGDDPDKIAYRGHTEDVRPDIAGDQRLNYYSVFIFGSEGRGRNAMRQVALYGGFADFNADAWPYGKSESDVDLDSRNAVLPASPCDPASGWDKECREWDEDRDGIPDNYYEASEGGELETALISAISDIVKHASSGTAASVLASGEGSGANLVQAVFYPKRRFADLEISWTSTLLNLWYYLDPGVANSTIREDSDLDRELDLAKDYVMSFDFDEAENRTVVNLYDSDKYGNVGELSYPNVELEDINYLWESGSMLHERNLAEDPRTIYTNIDDDSTLDDFDAANVSALQPFLNTAVADDEVEAKWTIDYIRGDDGGRCTNDYSVECDDDIPCASGGGTCDLPRNRTVTFNGTSGVWKLGDIIYSTPRIVSWIPLNNYDHTYDDRTYHVFVKSSDTYKNRGKVILGEAYGGGMVFTGANDGMLHAFKLGALEMISNRYKPGRKAALIGSDLGREEWAFIPKGALPYLKYLMDTDYCHLYYVDATQTVFDASIGTGDCTKENYWDCNKGSTKASWRTVLIGGMRLGGACKDTANASAYGVQTPVDGEGYSSYFALDITDLSNPELLWEFSAPGLGFASTGPAIIRINARSTEYANLPDKDRNGRWFAIFVSGPTGPIDTAERQFKGYSDQNLKLFVVDIKDGSLVRTIDTGIANAFGGSLFNAAADFDIDYQDDVIYIGYTKSEDAEPTAATEWTEGGVIRLVTGEDRRGTAFSWTNTALNPDKWVWSDVMENTGAITSGVTHLTSYATKEQTAVNITSGRLFFGTGRYFFKGDDSLSQRRLYGIKEPCLTAVTSSCAKDTSLSSYFCSACLTDTGTGLQVATGTLTDQTTTVQDVGDYGWYIDLDGTTAERVITDPVAIPNGAVFFTSFDPNMDICSYGGSTYIWAVDYKTGGAVSLRGKALLQVSTGAIKELDLRETKPGKPDSEATFSGRGNRRTTAIEGVPPPDQGLLIMVPPPSVDTTIHIQKK